MSLSVGIVGLPNVGKSTLFNALTKRQQAAAENYPFCTIEPNSAIVEVADPRLEALAKIVAPQQIIRATVEFTDIAGLVKGASKGEGLGNKFLANIRECDAILHVVRCFENDDIIHVQEGGNKSAPIDPAGDAEVIETELVLADMEQLQKRCDKTRNEAKSDPKKRPEFDAMTALLAHLGEGKPVRTFPRAEGDPILPVLRDLHFLTDKKTIYCANVAEDDLADPSANPHVAALKAYADAQGCEMVTVCAQMEADLADRQYDLTNTYNMYQDQKMTLSDLLFWPVDEELVIDTSMPVWRVEPVATESVVDFALEHNPGIQIASWQELNAKRELNTAKWSLLPTVGLYAGWSTSYYTYQGSTTNPFWNQFKNNGGEYVELSLSIPIWNRMSKHSAISRKQHALDKATAELDQKRRDVESEVRRAIQDRDGAATAYQQAQRKAEVQAEAYTLNLKKLEQGLISPLEFQTANNNYLKAQADEMNSLFKYLIKQAVVRYYNGVEYVNQ